MKKSAKKQPVRQEEPAPAGTTLQFDLLLPGAMRALLYEMVVGAGMQVVEAVLEQERRAICGPRYEHDAGRHATRHGYSGGELVLGGRRVHVDRPRARTMEGQEIELPSWGRWSKHDPLAKRAVEQVLVGVTTRKYDRSLEALPQGVTSRGTSKSAVSRRFVAATAEKVAEMTSSDLTPIELAALMVDGIHVGEHVVLVALGIDLVGQKHVLGLEEGATENTVACTSLLTNLRDRGLHTDRAILVVIDGGKALASAIRDVFGPRALIQRCQVHKRRNVEDKLPKRMRDTIGRAISAAYRLTDPTRAKNILKGLARQIEHGHPSAAASLREGLDETLTVMALGLTAALARTLSTTNPIENINGLLRDRLRNVKRWRDGDMVVRWTTAALLESAKSFRRLKGKAGMPKLVAALRAHDAKLAREAKTVALPGAIDRQKKAA